MEQETENLVRQSWELLSERQDEMARAFYARLFEIAPETGALFAGTDMASQRRKLLRMLSQIVRRIDRPGALVPELTALGARHVQYGATSHGYDLVGEALVWAIGQQLGPAMTEDVKAAWIEAYRLVADLMQRGAELPRSA